MDVWSGYTVQTAPKRPRSHRVPQMCLIKITYDIYDFPIKAGFLSDLCMQDFLLRCETGGWQCRSL